MGNHCHFLMRVFDPESVAAFMDYFKTETAHAINRLLGRRKRTVWEDGYDSVPILTLEDTINKIVYIYANPLKANLVSDIDSYPSVSSWEMYQSGRTSFTVPWIHRSDIEPIQNFNSVTEEHAHYQRLLETADDANTFTLHPDGWMDLFGVDTSSERDQINQQILSSIRDTEMELEKVRAKEGRRVLGAKELRAQPINKPYTPQKFSRRMWCICGNKLFRMLFIQFIKGLIASAKEVSQRWRCGDFSEPYPLGLFPPRFPRLANIRPGTVLA